MSVLVMAWVWQHSEARGNERLVLLAIADHAHDDGRDAWPSVKTLAAKTKLSERTVQRSIKALCALGELDVAEQAGGMPWVRPDRRPNAYRVVMERGDSLTPRAANGVTTSARRGDKSRSDGVTVLTPKTSRLKNRPEPSAKSCSFCGGDGVVRLGKSVLTDPCPMCAA